MTLQQMEYVVALDEHRNFVLAADACGVTQPTLSAMIQKLEDELGVLLFERKRKGLEPTPVGVKVISQARRAVSEARKIQEVVNDETGSLKGSLHIGIVPTIAPYLVPDFILHFTRLYPEVSLQIEEMKSSVLYDELSAGRLDMVLATPPSVAGELFEIPVYKEQFFAYFSEQCMEKCDAALNMMVDGKISLAHMDMKYMWRLQEGHCMNTSDFSFCMDRSSAEARADDRNAAEPGVKFLELDEADHVDHVDHSVYKAGSMTTLVRIVDRNGGFTIIPEMHLALLSEEQKANVHPLAEGKKAARTISLLIRSDYVRERLLNAVVDTLKLIIPSRMLEPGISRGPVHL